MTQHFATLGGLFQNGLSDASLKVRVAALKAVLALVSNMSGEPSEINIVKGLVPHILSTARGGSRPLTLSSKARTTLRT